MKRDRLLKIGEGWGLEARYLRPGNEFYMINQSKDFIAKLDEYAKHAGLWGCKRNPEEEKERKDFKLSPLKVEVWIGPYGDELELTYYKHWGSIKLTVKERRDGKPKP